MHTPHPLADLYAALASPPTSPNHFLTRRTGTGGFPWACPPFHNARSPPSTPLFFKPAHSPFPTPPASRPPSPLYLDPSIHGLFDTPNCGYKYNLALPHVDAPADCPVDSLTRERKGDMPALDHLLSVGEGRVLCLAADERFVYAGSQSRHNEITVFSRTSLQPLFRLLGHTGSVLALLLVEEKGWLVSSSSAGDVRIWSTRTLQPLYIIHPCDDTSGDIYSLAWDGRSGGTLYFGAQNTSIEWVNFRESRPTRTRKPSAPSVVASVVPTPNERKDKSPLSDISSNSDKPTQRTGRYKPHKFFDTVHNRATGTSGQSTPFETTPQCTPADIPAFRQDYFSLPPDVSDLDLESDQERSVIELEIGVESIVSAAHYGYVYALEMATRPDGSRWLISGSGDSDVIIWTAKPGGGLELLKSFVDLSGAVLSLAIRDDTLLYAGLQDGEIVIWDLETFACIRTINIHEADVMTMSVLGGDVYTSGADGRVLRLDEAFDCTAAFDAHSGTVLDCYVIKGVKRDGWDLITAGNDAFVKIWSIDSRKSNGHDADVDVEGEGDVMLYALSKLVAVPSVSDENHRESCRQGAHLLRKILAQLGAQAEVLSGEHGKNPLVLATFSGKAAARNRKRVLFYGHYDVQPADEAEWETNPWELSGRNGYLYGRGVSDNKGPILAVACAAATLQQKRELDVDLVMLIEGEEEAGSSGFAETVRRNRNAIGQIDVVLLSNSTWIGEEDPCVVFGMRGVIYADLTVTATREDAHSGVDGGAVAEPMFDIVRILAAIADNKGVKLPRFYDHVRPETASERQLLQQVAEASKRSLSDLTKVWRQPTFSIAGISSSASANKTVISKKVKADISMRLVPDQDLSSIVDSLKTFCRGTFDHLQSGNKLDINITHTASWWLTSLESPYFKALENAIQEVWGVAPLKIREGGTVPTIFWLEQEFKAPCVHLPLGQASDAGHLANERMKLLNLRNGKRVVESFLTRVASIDK